MAYLINKPRTLAHTQVACSDTVREHYQYEQTAAGCSPPPSTLPRGTLSPRHGRPRPATAHRGCNDFAAAQHSRFCTRFVVNGHGFSILEGQSWPETPAPELQRETQRLVRRGLCGRLGPIAVQGQCAREGGLTGCQSRSWVSPRRMEARDVDLHHAACRPQRSSRWGRRTAARF